jgi:heat shock protein HslJ
MGMRTSFCVAVAALVMSAQAASAEQLVGQLWRAEDIGGGGVIDSVQVTIGFAAGGKVTGSGGCNRLFGEARMAGASLVFGAIGTTRMACAPAVMQQERKFLGALAATRTFALTGPHLKLFDAAGVELVRFTPQR